MKSMKGEVVIKMEAEKAWEIYSDNDKISKVNPQMLAHAYYKQGDGSPGTLRVFTLGPAISMYVKESTEKIEKVENGKSVRYQVIGGELAEMYNPYIVTFTFNPLPGKEKDMCIAEWKAEFEPLDSSIPLPYEARDAALGFLMHFDSFNFG